MPATYAFHAKAASFHYHVMIIIIIRISNRNPTQHFWACCGAALLLDAGLMSAI
jgi:hypothetical protein